MEGDLDMLDRLILGDKQWGRMSRHIIGYEQTRGSSGRDNRMPGLNTYWNTLHLGHAVEARRREELDTPDHLLAHVSPLGWANPAQRRIPLAERRNA